MDRTLSQGEARRLPDLAIALKSIAAFWLLYVGLITLRAIVYQYPNFWDLLARRAVASLAGCLITFLVYLCLRPVAAKSLNVKAAWAAILCLPASILFSAANYTLFYVYAPLDADKMEAERIQMGWSPFEMAMRSIMESSLSWYFIFAAWAAFYVAMSQAKQLRLADRHSAMLAREAQEAQLRALRYQINPHFLFNTLNALSSLILQKDTERAEKVVLSLSKFLRVSLEKDPRDKIALTDEIETQRQYLAIEEIRFGARLRFEEEVPEDLADALVPSLILQPLVENAVKYGVARSTGPVRVTIAAQAVGDRLRVTVADDGAHDIDADPVRLGVGLENVRRRLEALYGSAGQLACGPGARQGFSAAIELPLERA
jgi:signal transduction histidine kinase